MSDRIDVRELEKAVARLNDVFVTKDVSEQEEMKRAHSAEASHTHWHAFVGRAISLHRGALGVDSIGRSATRGERWSKRAGARRTEPRVDVVQLQASDPVESRSAVLR